MKMTSKHYEAVRRAVLAVKDKYPSLTADRWALSGKDAQEYRSDCLYAATRDGFIRIGDGDGMPGLPWQYLTDDDIDEALKQILAN